jgi:hypothetical protein
MAMPITRSGFTDPDAVRDYAHAQGWTTEVDQDFCPECSQATEP